MRDLVDWCTNLRVACRRGDRTTNISFREKLLPRRVWRAVWQLYLSCVCNTCTFEECRESTAPHNAPWILFQTSRTNEQRRKQHHRGTRKWALYSCNANLANRERRGKAASPRPLGFHHSVVVWNWIECN